MKPILSAIWLIAFLSAALPAFAEDRAAPVVAATNLLLMDVVQAGPRIIAVGERGKVMRSEDQGRSWTSTNAPTTRTLTAVSFSKDGQTGMAVGHGGTMVRSDDGGASWAAVDFADAQGDSLLGITRLQRGMLLAYGAFGLFAVSDDDGKTWRRKRILGEDFDRHISQIIEDGSRLLLVGESGTIALSEDGGDSWSQVESPYEGSFFGALKAADGALLIFGMRGNIFRSTDGGHAWSKIGITSTSCLNGGSSTASGELLIAGNNGLLARSSDNGMTFKLSYSRDGRPLSKAISVDESLIYVGALSAGRIETAALAPARGGK